MPVGGPSSYFEQGFFACVCLCVRGESDYCGQLQLRASASEGVGNRGRLIAGGTSGKRAVATTRVVVNASVFAAVPAHARVSWWAGPSLALQSAGRTTPSNEANGAGCAALRVRADETKRAPERTASRNDAHVAAVAGTRASLAGTRRQLTSSRGRAGQERISPSSPRSASSLWSRRLRWWPWRPATRSTPWRRRRGRRAAASSATASRRSRSAWTR
eukprot:365883-Chlamydomonas_euryale.AAC.5